MAVLKSCAFYLTVSHVLVYISSVASKEMTYQEKAFYLSETECRQLENPFVAAPILLSAAQLVLLGKTVEIVNPVQGRYSMRVIPQCIMKGDTMEREIVIQNLGKTKCGSSNVEANYNYLFFLRNTSDPKIFHALNSGAKVVTTAVLWTDIFPMLCGINRSLKCSIGECPGACNYAVPEASSCIPGDQTVFDTFRNAFPTGLPTSTPKPSTAAMVKTDPPRVADKVISTPEPSTQKVAMDSKPSTSTTTSIAKGNADDTVAKIKEMTNSSKPSLNKTSAGTAPSSKQPTTTNMTNEVMTEKTKSDNKTETEDDSKENKVAPYKPMVNGTAAVQQSKSNRNGQGRIHSNGFPVIILFFVVYLLRS